MKKRLETYAVISGFVGPKVVLSKESKHGKKIHKHIWGSEGTCGLLVNKIISADHKPFQSLYVSLWK